MKKTSLSAMKILLIAGILCSCQKETTTHSNYNYKQETDKIETSIASGLVKNESYLTNFPKHETKASDDLKQKIMGALIKSYSKTNAAQVVNAETFGVLKDGSCGSYRELDIKMDCEDNRPASATSGYAGATTVVNGDVYYQFCLVNDRTKFPQISTGRYAVLSLDRQQATSGQYISFDRGFDNEDHNNENSVTINGKSQSLPFDSFPGVNIQGNSSLSFLLVMKNAKGSAKPPILAGTPSYAVLGSFGSVKGYIFSDDEDSFNANTFYSNTASESSVWFNGIMEFGSNTKIYVSKAR